VPEGTGSGGPRARRGIGEHLMAAKKKTKKAAKKAKKH